MNHPTKYRTLQALASETRYKIVMFLIEWKTATVQEVSEAIAMSHSATSHQLAVLLACDVVSAEKQGRFQMYRIAKTDAGTMARKLMRV